MKRNRTTVKMIAAGIGLVLALGACTGAGTAQEGAAAAPDTKGESGALSLRITTVNFGTSPAETPIQEAWIAMLEEKMGQELDLNFEYIHSGDYEEKLQVINAGGDLPDILTNFGMTKSAMDNNGSKGLYVDVAQHLEQLPLYADALQKDPDVGTKIYTPQGELYALFGYYSSTRGTAHPAAYTISAVKNKVLAEHNLEIPTTLEEIYQTAKALKEAGVSNYPIVLHEEWQNPEDMVYRSYHTSGGRYFNGTEYEFGPLSEDYKLALQYMNRLYTEGLISPDYFTHTVANGNAALADGSACIILSAWEGYPAIWATQYPDDDWVGILTPGSDKYPDTVWQFEREIRSEVSFIPHYGAMISAKTQQLDEALRFMDYQYDPDIVELLNWGIEGETFERDADGVNRFLLAGEENTDKLVALGLPVSNTCRAGVFPQNQDLDLWRIELNDDTIMFDGTQVVRDKLVAFSSERINAGNTAPSDIDPKVSLATGESETYAGIMTPVETYAREEKVKFIKGQRSFDEWEQYLDELGRMGDIEAAMELYNSKLS